MFGDSLRSAKHNQVRKGPAAPTQCRANQTGLLPVVKFGKRNSLSLLAPLGKYIEAGGLVLESWSRLWLWKRRKRSRSSIERRESGRSPNIVPFFGACDEGSTYFFVCEEAKNGKLLDYLFHAREEGRSLVWRKLLDAALGLHFLHERHVVHSDLKCNQILVSKDGVAMLTDFGLSFLATEQSSDEETVGAIRWKAPEVIRKDKPVAPNAQSDVYSLGMCVVEAVTGEVPWGQVPDPVVKFHVTRKKCLPRPKAFKSDAQWELVEKLCAFEPSKRMKLLEAIEMIREFAEEERFQERLQMMQQEDRESDLIAGDPPNIAKITTMGTLAKVQSVRTLMRRRIGGGILMAAA